MVAGPYKTSNALKTPVQRSALQRAFNGVARRFLSLMRVFRRNHLENLLIHEIERGRENRVEVLIGAGADLRAWNNRPLKKAAGRGQIEVLEVLFHHGIKASDDDSVALQYAVNRGHIQTARFLLQSGADIHARNEQAVINAAARNSVPLMQMMIRAKADVNARNGEPLRLAASLGNYHVVKTLLDGGATAGLNDNAALMEACEKGFKNTIEYLVAHGADVNARSGLMLERVAAGGHILALGVLLDAGAVFDPAVSKAAVLAEQNGFPNVVAALNAHAQKVKIPPKKPPFTV